MTKSGRAGDADDRESGAEVRVLSPPVDETQLLALAHRGGAPAAAALYDRFAGEVNAMVWSLLGADPDHDDIVHQVFCSVMSKAHAVREPGKLRAWVLTVTVNQVRTELRRRRRVRWLSFDEAPGRVIEPADVTDHEGRKLLAHVWSVLETLGAEDRLAFSLRFVEQRPLEEVAELLGCSLATAKRRIRRARDKFVHAARRDPELASRLGGEGER